MVGLLQSEGQTHFGTRFLFINCYFDILHSDVKFLKDCVGSEIENAVNSAAQGMLLWY